ncbi:MAG: 2-amino-4-hydroxy-6-hydroxymethyldihydropteridine diphosphokinase [Pseudomonadota bacterium]
MQNEPRADERRAATALIALGANAPSPIGGPRRTLEAALEHLRGLGSVQVLRVSAWRDTRAEPPGSGPAFVNAAAALRVEMTADGLLDRLHGIEAALGRPPRLRDAPRWRPRGVDLDLLDFDGAVLPDQAEVARWMALPDDACRAQAPAELILPHPRLHRRAFVLDPLSEIAPEWRHPLLRRTAAELLSALPAGAREGVRALS